MSAKIDPAEFVRQWTAGRSAVEIADAFEISQTSVATFACKLRKAGVGLPRRNAKRHLDVAALNALIAKARP
ncbi:MAG: hypothetical protein H0X39_13640 [Actinobacteria bacterium]|nr:hypothetical protein [Actinomycetota bacterium]